VPLPSIDLGAAPFRVGLMHSFAEVRSVRGPELWLWSRLVCCDHHSGSYSKLTLSRIAGELLVHLPVGKRRLHNSKPNGHLCKSTEMGLGKPITNTTGEFSC